MDWEKIPQQSRQQLLSILGEMAQSYLRTIPSLQKEIEHGKGVPEENNSNDIKQDTYSAF